MSTGTSANEADSIYCFDNISTMPSNYYITYESKILKIFALYFGHIAKLSLSFCAST
jgi:hypothetical protein